MFEYICFLLPRGIMSGGYAEMTAAEAARNNDCDKVRSYIALSSKYTPGWESWGMGLRFQAVNASALTWTSHCKAGRINKAAWLHMEAHFLLAGPLRIRKRNQWDIRQPRKNIYTAKNVREHFSAFSSSQREPKHQGPWG